MTTSEAEADLDLDSLASLSDDGGSEDHHRESIQTFLGDMCEECRGSDLPAHHATSLGHLGCLKRVVGEKKEDIALFDEDGSTPLYLAARKGHSHCVRWLVTQDLVPTRAANVRGETAAMVAAAEGQLKCLKLILFNGYDHHYDIGFDRDSGGLTLLHAAVLRDREAVALWLVDQFGETLVEMKTNDGLLALHIAAAKGYLQLVRTLATSSSASVCTQDVRGATPMFYSAQGGHVDCLSYMVEDMNGDLFISTHEEKSPLHVAVQGGHIETVQWLVGRMGAASLRLQTKDGATVMHYAAAMGHTDILRWLLSQHKSAEVAKMTDKEGGTAAHDAAAKGHVGCLKLLVELGLDIHQKDQDGVSPYQLAIQSGSDVCIQYVTSLPGDMFGHRSFWVRRHEKPTTSIDSGISCGTDDTASPFTTLDRPALSAERLPRTGSLMNAASRASDSKLPGPKRKSRRKSWKFWKSRKDDDENAPTTEDRTIPTCSRTPTPPPVRSQWHDISLEARLLPRKDALFPDGQPDGPGYSWRRKGSKSLFQQKHRSAPVCLPAEEIVGKAGDKGTDEGLSLADRQIEMIVSDIRDSPQPESAVMRKRRDSNWTFRRKSSSEVEAPDDLVTALVNLSLEDHVSEGNSPALSVRSNHGDKEPETPQTMRVTRAVVHSSDEDACAVVPTDETPNTLHDIDLPNQLIQVKDTEGVTVLSPGTESARVKKPLASRSYSDPTGTKRPASIAGLCGAKTGASADNDDFITKTDRTWDFHFGKPSTDPTTTTTATTDSLDSADLVQDVPSDREVTNGTVSSTLNLKESEPEKVSALPAANGTDAEVPPSSPKEENTDSNSEQERLIFKPDTEENTKADPSEAPARTHSVHRPRPAPTVTTTTTTTTTTTPTTTARVETPFKNVIQQGLERLRKPREITIVELDGRVVTCFTSLELETAGRSTDDTSARLYLLGRGIFGAVALCMQFYAFHHIPLGDATTVIFSSPIFIAFFAWLILKEAYGWFNFAVTLTTLTGVVLISKPSFIFGSAVAVPNTSEHLLGTLSAFGGAVFSALALVMIRKLGKAVHFFVHITYLSVFGMILTFVLLMALGEFKTPPCGSDRFYLIALGLCGVGGQTFLTKAFQLEKAAPVAIVRTMDIVFAFTWQFVFLGELPAWLSVGGALLVMSSAIAIAVKKWLLERQKQ
ncbi:PREDICTED: ankyrin repeat and KH domain-containing protein 1-like [Branchiostoma belcheri]|uniref:Ankyrin repeat and KH domain-containing protein 1-like n=1 Tax=Branchiostoma belcheri TaxID=7741 RepID=A0A6P4YS10_BRABE|nr:PREDICTED: ankyrin repeat and KH domain-containing protein 1-like [Branchiostoma belcheri]